MNVSRRGFLAGAAGSALVLGFSIHGCGRRGPSTGKTATFSPNAYLSVDSTGLVTIIIGQSELGQGVHTSLPMILAEELDTDWSRVRVQSAQADPAYDHPDFGMQVTGGSTSVSSHWQPLRKAGATARAMLIHAAALRWKVDATSCTTRPGHVMHAPSGRTLPYGELVEAAAALAVPKDVTLKSPEAFTLIGRPMPRTDSAEKVSGKTQFGIDVRRPGMLTAVVARPPVLRGKLRTLDDRAAKAIVGVKAVLPLDSGVAVVAQDYWTATRAREALQITWDEGSLAGFSSVSQERDYADTLGRAGTIAAEKGDVDRALRGAVRRVDVQYDLPYLAHAAMEPLNCVADTRPDRCQVWVGTQFPALDRKAASEASGVPLERVELHPLPCGGSFGRKAAPDGHYVREAVQISRSVGAPVKVIWTREDDMRGGYYRPHYRHRLVGGLDKDGKIVAWLHRIAGQPVLLGTPFAELTVKDGVDFESASGASLLLNGVPNSRIELHQKLAGPPVWSWRSVGDSHNGFVVESFIDELAYAARRDPLDFRLALLAGLPRYQAVLELAASKIGWASPRQRGRGVGIAVHQFNSYVAHAAEVSYSKADGIRVHRVVCAVDCGIAVNPDGVRAQMEGGIIMGLTAALHGRITLEKGRVQQSNFDDYPLLRMHEAPQIEVHIVPSNGDPLGVGEAGVPPIAPAVANALFAASGRRVRSLPMSLAL